MKNKPDSVSLRDYIACQALLHQSCTLSHVDKIVAQAYRLADAMIVESNKPVKVTKEKKL